MQVYTGLRPPHSKPCRHKPDEKRETLLTAADFTVRIIQMYIFRYSGVGSGGPALEFPIKAERRSILCTQRGFSSTPPSLCSANTWAANLCSSRSAACLPSHQLQEITSRVVVVGRPLSVDRGRSPAGRPDASSSLTWIITRFIHTYAPNVKGKQRGWCKEALSWIRRRLLNLRCTLNPKWS